jgi:hypothetical protein
MYFEFSQNIFFWIVCFSKNLNQLQEKVILAVLAWKKGEYFQEMQILLTVLLFSVQICFLHLERTIYE